jgi:hypothetical protein
MNQLFNTVNYFEFLLLTFQIVPGNKKAAEAFLRAAAFG